MTLLHKLLHITNFKSPLLRAVVPCVAAAVAIQATVAAPSIALQSERFFDVSGSVTYLAVGALSLYLPALRQRLASAAAGHSSLPSLPSLLAPFRSDAGGAAAAAAQGALNWRQVAITAMVAAWAVRCESPDMTAAAAQGGTSC